MPKYIYKAKRRDGTDKEGVVQAESEEKASKVLKEKNLIPIFIRSEKQKRKLSLNIPLFSGVSLTDRMMFTRNLTVMIEAGLSLPRALKIIEEQTDNKKLRKALKEMRADLVEGVNFSETVENHPDIFSKLFSSMIKVGEAGGKLAEVLDVLTRQMERRHDLEEKIKGALVYPAVIILAMVGIGIAMIVFVVPKISKTFEELEIDLPPTTRFVIGLGNSLVNQWYLYIGGLVFLIVLLSSLRKKRWFKDGISFIALRLPFVSGLVRRINSARTLRSLSSLISAGVSLPQSLKIVADISSNSYFKREIEKATEKVIKGEKLSDTLEGGEVYSSLVVQMIAVGEETGETSSVLSSLANFYEDQVARSTQNLASVIEPVIMLLVGGVIGFFAVSMIQPMYSMIGQF